MAQMSTTVRDILDKASLPEFQAAGLGTTLYEASKYSPVVIPYTIGGDITTATAAFAAPFAMVIDRIDLLTTVGEASNTVKVMKATAEMCTALVATTAKAITSMAVGVESAVKTLAAGDVVNVQAAGGSNGDKQRGILTFYGHRV
jgi:hypothetical protein